MLVKIDLPYRTHLDALRDALDLARQRKLQAMKIPGGRALVAANLFAGTPADTEEESARIFAAALENVKRRAGITAAFDTVFAAAGIEVIKIPPRAPKANAFAEQWVRTVRTECLDWVLTWNRRNLETVLAEYVAHYNAARPHRGIDLDVPDAEDKPTPSGPEQIRRIERVDVLGGLVHEYRHAA